MWWSILWPCLQLYHSFVMLMIAMREAPICGCINTIIPTAAIWVLTVTSICHLSSAMLHCWCLPHHVSLIIYVDLSTATVKRHMRRSHEIVRYGQEWEEINIKDSGLFEILISAYKLFNSYLPFNTYLKYYIKCQHVFKNQEDIQ